MRGLGSTAGFKMMIQDRADVGLEALAGTSFRMMVDSSQTPGLAQVFTTFTTRVPQLYVDVDRVKAKSMGIALADVNDTLQIYLGSLCVNDFNRFGRTYQVTAQADASFRSREEDISRLKTRNAAGDMVPLGTLVDIRETTGPDKVIRYNMYPAADINGIAMPGVSSGQAIALAQQLAANELPPGMNFEWTDEAALATWWKGFNDAALDNLVVRAVTNNHDLRIATANLKEVRALRRLTTFDLAPTVQANAGYANALLSKALAPPGAPREAREVELYDASFDAAWELDFFGRVRRSVQAANAQVGAFEATRLDVLVSVIAEVARNYFDLRGLQNQLDVARKNAEVQGETLKLTQSLLDGGRGTEFDVSRSRSLLNQTLSTIPPLEAAIQKAIYRIGVLTGQPPATLAPELSAPKPLPATLPAIALADPAGLLRRRPDIRAAERSLAAATARIGVATADLFPRVTFIGSVGLQAETFAGLGKNGADTWSFGPRITWAALDLGRVRARIKAADARTEASLAFYELTVLTALEETEGALVDFGQEQARQRFLQNSAQASQQAANLARQRFEGGSADFLSVLDAERTLLESQDRLAASQTRTVTALVAVYKALGGGVPVPNPKRALEFLLFDLE